ncbi:MAG: hypothetical protein LBC49_03250, partial [Bacteroidales bacterium]|nr:hypothetical protein [Bacteroidales bacterium]
MEILVQGTKGGSKVLYPTPTPNVFFRFAGDVRRIDGRGGNGQQAYSIAFAERGCIFSKYVGVRDVERSWDGNVAFSVFVPNNKKLAGSDVKMLLDELAGSYCQDYVIGGNLGNKQEDWTFVTALANQYENRLRGVSADDAENFQQGTAESAYVFYPDNNELQKYFDAPYQEEYKDFKQVFFIENNFQDLLRLLKYDPNADLTGRIDLENPTYRLLFKSNASENVKIKVEIKNGDRWSERSNNNKICKKNELRITWSKQYCQTITQPGRWDKIGSEFLSVDDNAKTVTVREIDLQPVRHTFSFEIRDREGNKLDNAEIILKVGYQGERKIENSSVTLSEEDLQNRCIVFAKKGNELISQEREIKIADEVGRIVLVLQKHTKVTFQVADDEGLVYGYNIQIKDEKGNWNNRKDFIEFYGDDIDKSWKIKIIHDDQTETFNYCPAEDDNPKFVKLEKKEKNNQNKRTSYKVDAGEYGTLKDAFDYYSNKSDGSDVKDIIVPKKGYKFTKYELQNNILVAQYRKKEPFYTKPEFIALSVIGFIAIVV